PRRRRARPGPCGPHSGPYGRQRPGKASGSGGARLLQYTRNVRPPGDLAMLGTTLDVRTFLERVGKELLRIDPAEVKALADAMYDCYEHGRMIFLIGNGGSGSNASHFCEDIGKGTLKREHFDDDGKKRFRIIS